MDELRISDYIIMCSDFEKNPDNTELIKDIENFISKLEIREYLPLKQKELITMEIITSLSPDFDAPGTAAFLENGRVSKGLLSYCVNLINDLPIISYNYFTVDAIYQYGLYEAVISRCRDDYNRLIKMIDDVVNASNIYKIVQTASLFNEDSYKDWLDSMNQLKDSLNSDSIKALIEISGLESPESAEFINTAAKMAMDSVNKEFDNENSKLEKAVESQEKDAESSNNKHGDDDGDGVSVN